MEWDAQGRLGIEWDAFGPRAARERSGSATKRLASAFRCTMGSFKISRKFLRRKKSPPPPDYTTLAGPSFAGRLLKTPSKPRRSHIFKPYVVLPGMRTLLQDGRLPSRGSRGHASLPPHNEDILENPVAEEDLHQDPNDVEPLSSPSRRIGISSPMRFSPEPRDRQAEWRAEYASKKKNQWRRWKEEVIPRLVAPYMASVARTMVPDHQEDCRGHNTGMQLEVTAVYIDRKSYTVLRDNLN